MKGFVVIKYPFESERLIFSGTTIPLSAAREGLFVCYLTYMPIIVIAYLL